MINQCFENDFKIICLRADRRRALLSVARKRAAFETLAASLLRAQILNNWPSARRAVEVGLAHRLPPATLFLLRRRRRGTSPPSSYGKRSCPLRCPHHPPNTPHHHRVQRRVLYVAHNHRWSLYPRRSVGMFFAALRGHTSYKERGPFCPKNRHLPFRRFESFNSQLDGHCGF